MSGNCMNKTVQDLRKLKCSEKTFLAEWPDPEGVGNPRKKRRFRVIRRNAQGQNVEKMVNWWDLRKNEMCHFLQQDGCQNFVLPRSKETNTGGIASRRVVPRRASRRLSHGYVSRGRSRGRGGSPGRGGRGRGRGRGARGRGRRESPRGSQDLTGSQGSPGRRGSPVRRGRQGSPVRRGRQGSPGRRGRQGSPVRRGRQGSPVRRGRQGSPVRRGRQGSPGRRALRQAQEANEAARMINQLFLNSGGRGQSTPTQGNSLRRGHDQNFGGWEDNVFDLSQGYDQDMRRMFNFSPI